MPRPVYLTLAQIERMHIERALKRNGGVISKAAAQLDIHPRTITKKLRLWAGQDQVALEKSKSDF